jgi:NAD(P)-dependent dehydrogenase (short-subunit alcohol dehydrogenase family)
MPGERTCTADGIEAMFATHVLAPWMLTDGLFPLLKAAAPSRVINVTSGGQYGVRIPAGDLQSEDTRYGPKKVYARTKREQVVLTREWARRLQPEGISVHAMHPGWADTKGVQQWMPMFRAVTRPFIRTPEQGDGHRVIPRVPAARRADAGMGVDPDDRQVIAVPASQIGKRRHADRALAARGRDPGRRGAVVRRQDRSQDGRAHGVPAAGDIEGNSGGEFPDAGGTGALPLGPQQAEVVAVGIRPPARRRTGIGHRWLPP